MISVYQVRFVPDGHMHVHLAMVSILYFDIEQNQAHLNWLDKV